MSVSFLVLLLGLLFHNGKAKVESQGCHSPDVERTAEEVLQQINQDRTDGYILTLNRLYDLSSTSNQEKSGSVYNLTIDVLETKCHSISKKPWKQCEVRGLGDIPVYGECQASVQVDAQVKLESYSCALREVAATAIVHVCPDCPTADNLNEPVIKETAKLALQKFNKESHLANYFALGNITKASLQWVVGPSYFVEFTVLETECSKETDFSELTHCQPMNCQFAHRGFCTGSHKTHEEAFKNMNPVGKDASSFQKAESVEVKCEIYEPQAATVEEQPQQLVAKVVSGHPEQHHHNHTHLHHHEHVHSVTQGSDVTVSNPKGLLGRIVFEPATPRSAPTASSCPGARRHNLGLRSPLL
ncbi:fetuin-B [Poecilia latipinna]|uniref:fetuin-B n=1 Tax=Poecilia latipinna TaxID=48699 RepID=UPI00072E7F8D|nr:PREDICTED: fetuin-B-like [Poecilia latipinna]